MSLVQLNPKAEQIKRNQALLVNANAAVSLQSVLKTNLGPKGTLKMLVSGAGDIKLTKDGKTLLSEMSIIHPTAAMIARSATAQDDITGDGTTSNVVLIGELMKQAERSIQDGIHPRIITEGYELAKQEALKFLDTYRLAQPIGDDLLQAVARTSLNTKLPLRLASIVTDIVVEAVKTVRKDTIDLHMVEIMKMQHESAEETRLIKGLVLDHGGRHPNMPSRLKKCYILNLNVSLEYEKTEVNSGFFYSSPAQKDALIESERKFTDEKVRKIVEFKQAVCTDGNAFVIINQKGIDPLSLDMLANNGILALRRAKRRNAERLLAICGAQPINSVEALAPDVLGYAEDVYEYALGEEKYTFVEGVSNPSSCTILIKGPTAYIVNQIHDSVKDGLKAVRNVFEDQCLVPGAGAFFLALRHHLRTNVAFDGKLKFGGDAFCDAMAFIPKTLLQNAGLDPLDLLPKIEDQLKAGKRAAVDLLSGRIVDPAKEGIWDNYCVLKQLITSSTIIASNLLLVDEIVRAGRNMSAKQ